MRSGVTFLMYHAVVDDIQPSETAYTVTPAQFESQMRYLAEMGYETRTVSELDSAWTLGKTVPPKTVAVTFDDGFACLHETALPIMKRFGIRATAYLISGYLDRMSRYDSDLGIRARPMLSRSQVLELAAEGIEIGSHSVNHHNLHTLTPRGLDYELRHSRSDLEDLTTRPITSFAFPRGCFNRFVYDAVKRAGYNSACAVTPGRNHDETDRFLLRRAQIGIQTDPERFPAILRFGATPYRLARTIARERLIDWGATLRGIDPIDLYRHNLREAFIRFASS